MRQAEAPVSSEDIRRLLWRDAVESAWAFDRAKQIHWICESAAPLYGRSPEDLLGAEWRRKVSAIFSGRAFLLRHLLLDPSGASFSLTHFPLRSPDGAVRFVGGVARRVTPGKLDHASTSDRLSRFLHDELAQNLSVAGLQLDLLVMDFGSAVPALAERAGQIQDLLESMMQRVREVNADLTERLSPGGLAANLERLAARLRVSLSCDVFLRLAPRVSIPTKTAGALYAAARLAAGYAGRKISCSRLEFLLKSTPCGPVLEIRGRTAGKTRSILGRHEADAEWLLLEQHAARCHLGLWLIWERDKGMLIKVQGGAPLPEGSA
jgi:hypothetical protein